MPTPRKPQDHQPKAINVKATPVNTYVFTHDGIEYQLPSGTSVVDKVPGRLIRDAYVDGENGQMRLGFAMLELVADPDALDALYDMPAPVMLEHVAAWMNMDAAEGDASLGESLRSSR